jgi:hypothetical protein
VAIALRESLIALAAARLATNLATSSSPIDNSIACRHAVMTLRDHMNP